MTELPPYLAEHYEDPFHYGPCTRCTHAAELRHDDCPSGADLLVVEMEIDDDQLKDVWFDGDACPWCQSIASFVIEQVSGSPVERLNAGCLAWQRLRQSMTANAADAADAIADTIRRLLADVPERQMGCADLVWNTLCAALQGPEWDDPDEGPNFAGPSLGDEQ